MGLRPQISVIIGATDVSQGDSRFQSKLPNDSFSTPLPPLFPDGSPCRDGQEGKLFEDVIYNPENSEDLVEGVVGYILEQVYATEISYALYTCFPDIFNEEEVGYGYKEFPRRGIADVEKSVLASKRDSSYATLQAVQLCSRYGLFYEYESCDQTAFHFQTAQKTLELAGWKFPIGQLTKLLIWNLA